MGRLTQIRLDCNIFQQIDVLVGGVGIWDLSQCLCDKRWIIVIASLRTHTYHKLKIRKNVINHIPLISLSLRTYYCCMFPHHGSLTLELGTGEPFGNILQDGNNIDKESTRNQEFSNSPDRFFRHLDIGVVIRANIDAVCHR